MAEDNNVNLIHDPGGLGRPLDELWAWVAVHGEGDEALVGLPGPVGGLMPGVFGKRENAERYRDLVKQLANDVDKKIELRAYVYASTEETFE